MPLVYLGGWVLLGAIALLYLALLIVRPDLAQRLIVPGTPEGNQGQRAWSRAVAEMGELRNALEHLESQLSEARSVIHTHERRSVALEIRLAAIEARTKDASIPVAQAAPVTQAAPAAQAAQVVMRSNPISVRTEQMPAIYAKPDAKPGGDQHPADRLAGRAIEGTVAEPPAPSRRDSMAAPQLRLAAAATTPGIVPETSVAPAAVSPAAPEMPAAAPPMKVAAAAVDAPPARPQSPPMGLLIATGPSLDAVRLTWLLLQEGHKSTLKSLEPRYLEADGEAPVFQLVAGPIAGRDAASRACEKLKARQARCSVIPFAGKAL